MSPDSRRAGRALVVGGVLACLAGMVPWAAQAQVFHDEAEWKEAAAPTPPKFSQDKLIPVEMPAYMSLKFGVDPSTIKITDDGVVSYVVVATHREGGGANAFFEGIHCATEEYKTYARFNEGAWTPEKDPQWKRIGDRNSGYTRAISAQGMCRDHATQVNVRETVRAMTAPIHDLD